jgi:hypothetical protein
MEPNVFKDHIGKVKEEKAKRVKRARLRPNNLRFICLKIQGAHNEGKEEVKVSIDLTKEEKALLSESGVGYEPIKGYNPSTHDDMIIGYTLKW